MHPLPTLFISHGSPMLALEAGATTKFLRGVAGNFKRPDAIIIASAHFETKEPMVTGSAHPATIHDFQGFPKELYQLRYPAPGSPELAGKIKDVLAKAGVAAGVDNERGLDHGAWNPLLLMYPQADIPVVEISVQPHKNAAWHFEIGRALRKLRGENILVIGTGNLTHNLYEAMRGGHFEAPEWVTEFAEWVAGKIGHGDVKALLNWETAPHAKRNHPTPEHFLPLFVALGAADEPLQAKRLHSDTALGVLAMDAYEFG